MSTFNYTDIEAGGQSRAVKHKDGSEAAAKLSRIIKRKDRPAPLDQEKFHLQHDAFDSSQRSADRASPRAPEVVDLAAPTSWSRRTMTRIPSRDLAPSPGAQSKRSIGRQSEMSFGILDYYTGDASPCCSPTIPATSSTADSAPKTSEPQTSDPAIERFDFGLKSSTPTQPGYHEALPQCPRAKTLASESDTQAGAERSETSTGDSPSASADRCVRPTLHKKTYSLFPSPNVSANRVPQIPSTPKAAAQPPPTTLTQPVSTPPYQQPNPAFRPRKESLPRSMRSRKDSMISHRSTSDRQIPLRLLSSSTTASASSTTTTTTPKTDYYSSAVSANSPPDRSRWSDETIASPTATTVRDGGPRTSFGSLLGAVGGGGSDNSDYPACFFEDDDEEGVPLKRKLAWKKKWSTGSSSSTLGGGRQQTARRREKGRGDPMGWRKVTRVLLCGGCGGGGAGGRVRGV
ncbi:hypothetical protein KC323_g8413 [Hortaea werneckii]|nr:hypothetical protein KC323_g8413 [Hortaea werneckii]